RVLIGVDAAALIIEIVAGAHLLLREWEVGEQFARDWVNAVVRYAVVWKRRGLLDNIARRIENARGRVIDDGTGIGEIAVAFGGEWHRDELRQCLALAQPFPVKKEEEPIPAVETLWQNARTAEGQAILVALEGRDGCRVGFVEVVFGVERRVTHELKG